MARRSYRVLRGINYPPLGRKGAPEKRAESGDVVDDLPTSAIEHLLAKRAIMLSEPTDEQVSITLDGE